MGGRTRTTLHMRSASVRNGSRKTKAGKSSNLKSPKTTSERQGQLAERYATKLESQMVVFIRSAKQSDQRDSKPLKAGFTVYNLVNNPELDSLCL